MLSAPELCRAQPTARNLKFDVASVKPNRDAVQGSIVRTPNGLTAHNVEFNRLVEMAFQTRLTDLSKIPRALRSKRFDIIAKAAERISGDQYWEMLQRLLEDRFMLEYHRETKDVHLYALILAKKGTALGSKISRSANADCPINPGGRNFCGVSARPGLMIGQRVPMARIADELPVFAGRPVQDQTGLLGSFDFELTWTPDEYISNDGHAKMLNGIPVDMSAPSFFPAIQEELGLKLESSRGQVEILVIDQAENTSEN
jgi:uncharacterized protein (TIGR03435 family)